MGRIILITGGARSGKSSIALEKSEAIDSKRLFIATSPHTDLEMQDRIRRHQQERQGRGWETLESEIEIARHLEIKGNTFGVILIDCITLWVNNLMFHSSPSAEINEDHIKELCDEWLNRVPTISADLICVTNEVGLGIVPDNPVARKYRDLVGAANQCIGKAADEVILVSCGIPHTIKP